MAKLSSPVLRVFHDDHKQQKQQVMSEVSASVCLLLAKTLHHIHLICCETEDKEKKKMSVLNIYIVSPRLLDFSPVLTRGTTAKQQGIYIIIFSVIQ